MQMIPRQVRRVRSIAQNIRKKKMLEIANGYLEPVNRNI